MKIEYNISRKQDKYCKRIKKMSYISLQNMENCMYLVHILQKMNKLYPSLIGCLSEGVMCFSKSST